MVKGTKVAFKRDLVEIFNDAIKAVSPSILVRGCVEGLNISHFKKIFLTGFGKASVQMAEAVEESIGMDLITEAIIITKYGHIKGGNGLQATSDEENNENKIVTKDSLHVTRHSLLRIFEAGHPVPDQNGLKATVEILRLVSSADKDTLVLCLISGGGSALLVSPYNGITLSDKQKVTELLLKAGVDINELNTVRKHISKVKGGRLAEAAYPAKVISLILSDVIGDRLDMIASGPTAPDQTTYADALNVISKYGVLGRIPRGVMDVLEKGREGKVPETPDKNSPVFRNVENIIIGNNLMALESAKRCAMRMGYEAEIITTNLKGEARDAGMWLASEARKFRSAEARKHKKPLCLISGGETTVTVKGDGLGGRNMELALSFAMEIEGINGITLLSAGTDGIDGPTDSAGAIVDGETVPEAKRMGLDPREYLNNNDSYNFFKKTGELFTTGFTGTNVMDIQIAMIE
jgi:glycerate-2-kinase